jgi:ABC-type transport system involved in multi-copper enzyme maturation permease subunit
MVLGLVFMGLEFVLQSSRFLAREWKEQTLPGLVVLPASTARIVYSKFAGCLLGLVPALVVFVLGMLLNFEAFTGAMDAGLVQSPFLLSGLVNVLLIAQLAAFFSLVVKRGALLIALVVWFFPCYFFVIFWMGLFAFTGGKSIYGFTIAARVAVLLVFHYLTWKRLQAVSAE